MNDDSPRAVRPRVASWPHWYGPNPYLPMLYDALARHGVDHVADVPLALESFVGPHRRADMLHLHWLYPLVRQQPGGRLRGRARARAAVEIIQTIRDGGVPVVWTLHNLTPHDGFRAFERRVYRDVYDRVDLRVFHSEDARRRAAGHLGADDRASLVTYHGNYRSVFPPPRNRAVVRREEGVAPDEHFLLCFGQIRAYKGFDLAVRAVRLLDDLPCRLLIAGRPIDGSVRRCVRAARGAPNVRVFAEEVPAQRLSDLLHAADVVLLPYREITGSGALLHAMTAGRGVVASDLPYFREILGREPEAGVLTRPLDAPALADGIRAYFGRPRAQREAAASRLAGAFEWEATVAPLATWIHQRWSSMERG